MAARTVHRCPKCKQLWEFEKREWGTAHNCECGSSWIVPHPSRKAPTPARSSIFDIDQPEELTPVGAGILFTASLTLIIVVVVSAPWLVYKIATKKPPQSEKLPVFLGTTSTDVSQPLPINQSVEDNAASASKNKVLEKRKSAERLLAELKSRTPASRPSNVGKPSSKTLAKPKINIKKYDSLQRISIEADVQIDNNADYKDFVATVGKYEVEFRLAKYNATLPDEQPYLDAFDKQRQLLLDYKIALIIQITNEEIAESLPLTLDELSRHQAEFTQKTGITSTLSIIAAAQIPIQQLIRLLKDNNEMYFYTLSLPTGRPINFEPEAKPLIKRYKPQERGLAIGNVEVRFMEKRLVDILKERMKNNLAEIGELMKE